MAKPLFRWTVGCCLRQGLDILAESVHRTTKALGLEKWDWAICYNGLNREELQYLQKMVEGKPIQLMAQTWATCPIDDNCQTPRIRKDGTFEHNGERCGGTLWKVCPARVRMETHEIVMDNDVVLLQKFPQIDEWLSRNDHVLILEEPIRFYGRYDCLFPPDQPCLNSGLMGFPPGYDFGTAIHAEWARYGRYMNLSQADEQGLLTHTLNQMPSVRIKKEQMIEILNRDFNARVTGREEGIHFTQANRIDNHRAWQHYKEVMAGHLI